MKIEVTCNYCGKMLRETDVEQTQRNLSVDNFRKLFKKLGFIVEENGEQIDTYCSRPCAAGTTKL